MRFGTNFECGKNVEDFRFPRERTVIVGHQTEEPTTAYKTPRNEISLPLICIIQRARERGGRILLVRVESCVLEGEVGGNGLNYDPPRNLWIGGRREAAGECARFAVNFFFFFFFS